MQVARRAQEGSASPNLVFVAGLSLGAAVASGFALAQTAAPAEAPAAALTLPELSVTASPATGGLAAPTGNPRLPGTVRDIPQTVNVVPQEVLREQTVTTLDQALRNVPSITSTIG